MKADVIEQRNELNNSVFITHPYFCAVVRDEVAAVKASPNRLAIYSPFIENGEVFARQPACKQIAVSRRPRKPPAMLGADVFTPIDMTGQTSVGRAGEIVKPTLRDTAATNVQFPISTALLAAQIGKRKQDPIETRTQDGNWVGDSYAKIEATFQEKQNKFASVKPDPHRAPPPRVPR